MSRIRLPFLLTLTLLLAIGVSAQMTPQAATPQTATPAPATPQAATPATPQSTPTPGDSSAAGPSAQDQARATIEKVAADLNLTPDQKSKLEPILTNEIQLVHTLKADTSMTTEQKQAKFKDQLTADHAKIDSILTPEQKTKLGQLNQQKAQGQGGGSGSPSTPPQTPKQ